MDKFTYQFLENTADLEEAFEIRRAVFVKEQGIDESLVFDGLDTSALQLIVRTKDQVVGTGRVRFLNNNQAKVERMAVLQAWRRRGIGKGIMGFLADELKRRRIQHVILHAQYETVDFYRSCGYRVNGAPFYEAGIKHILMERHFII